MDSLGNLPGACKAYVYAPFLGLCNSCAGVGRSGSLIFRSPTVRKAFCRTILFNVVLLTFAYVIFKYFGPVMLGILVEALAVGYDQFFSFLGLNFRVVERVILWRSETASLYDKLFCWFWAAPVLALARVCSMFWYEKISDEANSYYDVNGKNRFARPASSVMSIADVLYSAVVATFYYVMVLGVSYIPYVGELIAMVLIALLYSFYIFEYTWFAQGVSLPQRVVLISTHWTYFAGFGLPLSFILAKQGSAVTAGILPLYIIAAASCPMPTARDISTPFYMPAFTFPLFLADAVLRSVSVLQRTMLRRARSE